jgi:WD40-like Beta Propeller Repeat
VNSIEQDGTHPASRAGRSGFSGSWFALVTAAVFAVLLFAAVPALAAETIAEPGTGAGQVAFARSVAVDQATGIVYVGEENGRRIDEFDPSRPAGERLLLAFGWGVRNQASELQTCTTATGCEMGLYGSGTGEVRPTSLVVDASHDVYASDAEQYRVEKYTSAGAFVLMFGKEVNKTAVAESATRSAEENVCPAPGHPGDVCGAGVRSTAPGGISTSRPPLTIDSSGNIWVGDQERLEEFSPAGNYLAEVSLPGSGEVSGLDVDTSSSLSHGDFYTLRPNIPGRNEIQSVHIPSSGSFELCFDGSCTPPIEVIQGPSGPETRKGQIQTDLESLPTIGPGNIRELLTEVGNETIERIEFGGTLARIDVPQLTASSGATVETEEQGRAFTPGVITKRTPTGEAVQTVDASGFPNSVAVDPVNGDLFASDQFEPGATEKNATLLEFSPSGAELEAFGTGSVLGSPEGNSLAFGDQAQRLYVASAAVQGFAALPPGPFIAAASQQAKPVATTLATVHASVNPEGAATTYHFDYITDQQYTQDGNQFGAGTLETAESAVIGSGFAFQQVSGALSNLKPETSYHFRTVATNSRGVTLGERDEAGNEIAATFTTLPAALIDSVSASSVTAESATLDGEIDPLGLTTSYRFEYLTEAAFLRNEKAGEPFFTGAAQAPLEPASVGSGEKDVPVSQHLQGLQSKTSYRYRLVAQNRCNPADPAEVCTVSSVAGSFVTQSQATAGLPDDRGWEMVSPADKHGSLIGFMGTGRAQAAAAGGAITFGSLSPLEANPLGYGGVPQSTAVRGPSGWTSRQINTAHAGTVGATGGGTEFRFFSPDLSRSLLRPLGPFEPSLSAEASESTPYLRTGLSLESPNYRPLVTGCPAAGETCTPTVEAAADVPAGTVFGTHEGTVACPRSGVPALCGPDPIAVTPDLTHVVLSTEARLTADSVSGILDPAVYEWSANATSAEALRLVSVLPDGTASGKVSSLPSSNEHIIHNVISTDGSRIVWESGHHLYLRYNATEAQSAMSGGQCIEAQGACTLQLDAVREGSGKGSEHPVFQFASEDGSRIFFTDEQSLTPDSGAVDGAPDLYECQIAEVAGRTHCSLTDLTPRGAGGESAGVLGNVLGGAEDGSLLYFLANGVLAPGAKPGDCEKEFSPAADFCNLYVVHDGSIRLVAVVSGADRPLGADVGLYAQPTRVSPDGRWLAFMSQRSLTGYDNRDAVSGQRDEEVFLYHAAADGAQIDLACPSCNPTGARPHGAPSGSLAVGLDGPGEPWPGKTWLAASLPSWQVSGGSLAAYQSRYLSDAGRLFFNATDSLTPGDTNGTWDVYQYEPSSSVAGAPPSDSCSPESPTYVNANEGCTDLISSGTSPVESGFLDASESGDEVFFVTSASLSARDKDTAPDVYDARVDGGEPGSHGPPACEGDACQSPVSAPDDPTPGSLTFQGPGNLTPPVLSLLRAKSAGQVRAQKLVRALKACAKLRSRSRHAKCVRAAKTRYGAKTKAKRATNSRRAAR